jgi:hypothetical protein
MVSGIFHLIRTRRPLDDIFELLQPISTNIQQLNPTVKEPLYLALGSALLRIAFEIGAMEDVRTTVQQVLQHIYTLLAKKNGPPPPQPSDSPFRRR